MQPDDFDWSLLSRSKRLHLSGITPALSQSCLETVRRAMSEANNVGVQISFDLNYRAKLWTWEECRPVMHELAAQSQIAITALRDGRSLLDAPQMDAEALARALYERWQQPIVIITCGSEGSVAFDGQVYHAVAAVQNVQVVDRIGAGDAFAAGLLAALLNNESLPKALRYGNALAALKLTLAGDLALINQDEITALLAEDSLDIQR
jgi:2-dehydro-3-deoxygluconokinase